jgi:hypothetical protein|tara:strand:- start:51 stop:749 length:699 start_codon:yes stop_codon:yes gene_type:complete
METTKEKTDNSIVTISVKGYGEECCQGMIDKAYYEIYMNKYRDPKYIDDGWGHFLAEELNLAGYYELSDILSVVGVKWDDGEMSIMSSEDNFPFEYVGELNLEELGPLDGDPDMDSSYIGFTKSVTDQFGKEVVGGSIEIARSKGFSSVTELIEGKKLVTVSTSEFFDISIDISVPNGSFELGKLHFLTVSTDCTGYGRDYGDFIVGVSYEEEEYYFDYPSGSSNPGNIDFE